MKHAKDMKTTRQQTLDTLVATPAAAAGANQATIANTMEPQAEHTEHTGSDWEKFSEKILSHMNNRFDKLDEDIRHVQLSQAELFTSVSAIQDQIKDQDDRIGKLEATVAALGQENATLRTRLEGHSRRNNIKIFGIPEGEENNNPTDFVQALIPKLLGENSFNNAVLIDRAHRAPRPRPTDGAKPRAIFARVHFFKEKELILRLRRSKELLYKGNKVLIYPDYTAEVMRQRREFNPVMATLRGLKVEFHLLFPAKLRILHQGNTEFFSKPGEAMTFINSSLRNQC